MSFDDYKKRNASRCYPPAVVLGLVNECDRLFFTFFSKSTSNFKTGGILFIRYIFLNKIFINHISFQFMIRNRSKISLLETSSIKLNTLNANSHLSLILL